MAAKVSPLDALSNLIQQVANVPGMVQAEKESLQAQLEDVKKTLVTAYTVHTVLVAVTAIAAVLILIKLSKR